MWTATARLPKFWDKPYFAKSFSESFRLKRDAETWLANVESQMKLGTWTDPRLSESVFANKGYADRKFADAIQDYKKLVTVNKKSAKTEIYMLDMFLKEEFANRKLKELNVQTFIEYRDKRIKQGRAPSTIRNNLNTISAIYEWLIYEKMVKIENPIVFIRKAKNGLPRQRSGRTRRLRANEEQLLINAINNSRVWYAKQWKLLFPLLLATGMRLSEATGLKVGWIRQRSNFAYIPDSKNNAPRRVAIPASIYQQLIEWSEGFDNEDKIFRLTKDNCTNFWKKLKKDTGIVDLHIHDLRHEALSRFAEQGVELPLIKVQSGHKTTTMLMRYLHPDEDKQYDKLFGNRP